MVTKPTRKRRRAQVRGRSKSRWLRAIGGGLAVLLVLELAVFYFIFYDQSPQSVPAGLCPNIQLDASGQIRDKGFKSCDNLVNDKTRTDLVRDSFNRR